MPRNFQSLAVLGGSLSIFLISLSTVARADNFALWESKFRYDNNLGNAESPYIVSDTTFINALTAGQFFVLGEQDYLLTLQGKIKNETYQRLHGLSNNAISASAELKHKLGLGAYAPWLALNGTLERSNFSNRDRNAWAHRLGLKWGQRLSERSSILLSASFEGNHAYHNEQVEDNYPGNVFEKRSRFFSSNWNYSYSDNTILSLGWGIRKGDVNITTVADYDELYASAKAIRPDPTFGAERDVYRVQGNTHILSFGLDTQVSSNWRAGVQVQRQFTYTEGDNRYYKNQLVLNAQYQF